MESNKVTETDIMFTPQALIQDLIAKFGEAHIFDIQEPYGMLTFGTNSESIVPLLEYLYDHSTFQVQFLTDITAVHFPEIKGKELCVVYHLHSLQQNVRFRIKTYLPASKPHTPTLTGLYASANWMERETYDFFGVFFDGHPNLIRILNIEEMDYYPMLKEYPLEDATRQDKIDALFGRG